MDREIKFQFLYKGIPFSSENPRFKWHKKAYTLSQLCLKPLSALSDVHGQAELVARRQYTGLKDMGGTEIYEGDILRDAERGRFTVKFLEATFRAVFIECDDDFEWLDDRDFEVIGNIHENPDLLIWEGE